jgi:hypothetical protein
MGSIIIIVNCVKAQGYANIIAEGMPVKNVAVKAFANIVVKRSNANFVRVLRFVSTIIIDSVAKSAKLWASAG